MSWRAYNNALKVMSLTRRFVCVVSAIGFAHPAPGQGRTPQQQPFIERVEVARILIDTRVVDDFGRPVLGLDAGNFEVKIDGKPARVESEEWVGGNVDSNLSLASTDLAGVVEPAPRGRLIVFLVQKSLEPTRAMGLLRWPQVNEPMLAGLTPDDRVAVLSFDSHLKAWLDFTSDIDRVRKVMARDVMFRDPAPINPGPEPSLLARLSRDQ